MNLLPMRNYRFLILIALFCLFAGCQVAQLKTPRYTFTHVQLGVNTALKKLTVFVLPNGAHMFSLNGLGQNQSEAAGAIASAVTSTLAKSVIP